MGVNGAGKSTLLKMLAGALAFDRGRARARPPRARCTTTPSTSWTRSIRRAPCSRSWSRPPRVAPIARLRSILGSFLFSGDTVDKRIAVLSGGEKARVALAKMLVRPAALLCMDEPTNHLDLASKEVLEEALAGFTGTIVFISHDRYFINRIATQVVEVGRGRLTTHLGNYDDYLERKAAAAAARREPERPTARTCPAEPARRPRQGPRSPRHREGHSGPSRAKGRLERGDQGHQASRLQGVETQIPDHGARGWRRSASRWPILISTATASGPARSPRRARTRRSRSPG